LGCTLPFPIEPKRFIISLSIVIITFLELAIIEKIVKAPNTLIYHRVAISAITLQTV
jgi:hypothetical protein